MFDAKLNISQTQLSTTQSNIKRELPSHRILLDTMKNRISASISEAKSEESENMSSPPVHDAASYTNITLQESDLQKMAVIMAVITMHMLSCACRQLIYF